MRHISELGEEARRFLMDDLRANGRKAVELSLINDIFAHYDTANGRDSTTLASDKKDVKFSEIAIPNRTKCQAADFSQLGAFSILIRRWRTYPLRNPPKLLRRTPHSLRPAFLSFARNSRFPHRNNASALISIGGGHSTPQI